MAYRIKDYTGLWITRGWFHIRQGQTRSLWMPTRNKIFYYYGYMVNGGSTWAGNKPDSRKRWVRTRQFLHASGRLSGQGVRQVKFRKRTVTPGGFYRLNMTCRN